MEARLARAAFLAAVVASLGAGYRTQNFVVDAPTTDLAEKIGKAAEKFRHDLAVEWLGKPLPNWPGVCPIHAQVAPHLGAGGATSFMFDHGDVFGWQMNIQGSEERILDSVLPHEVTHTIFASYFRRPLPRWADEGACTTVEDISERTKQDHLLIQFLKTGRGIAFSQMFVMTEYPQDILPLYAQGYSLARYLIAAKGHKEFLNFVGDGMNSEDWTATLDQHYGFHDLGVLQTTWLEWVKQGSPMQAIASNVTPATAISGRTGRTGTGAIVRAQGPDRSPRVSQVALTPGEHVDATQPKTDLVAIVPVSERRNGPATSPIRNGSVTIDNGQPATQAAATELATTAGPPPLPTSIATRGPAAYDGWRGARSDVAVGADSTSAPPGQSVYGQGAGLIHHSGDGAQAPPADVAASNYSANEVVRTTQLPRQKLLEWTR